MKNIKIFETIRQQAIELDALLIRQKADSERLETMFYKAWKADPSDKSKEVAFHLQCDKTRQLEDRILNNKPYMGERLYMTECLHSDAHAYEVLEVYSRDRMDVRRLKATEKPEAREARLASFIPGGFVGTRTATSTDRERGRVRSLCAMRRTSTMISIFSRKIEEYSRKIDENSEKMKKIAIFCQNCLVIKQKSCTFAA